MYSPILLFVYNRPEHTRRVIESLQANAEAAESRLFIYADPVYPKHRWLQAGHPYRTRRELGACPQHHRRSDYASQRLRACDCIGRRFGGFALLPALYERCVGGL